MFLSVNIDAKTVREFPGESSGAETGRDLSESCGNGLDDEK